MTRVGDPVLQAHEMHGRHHLGVVLEIWSQYKGRLRKDDPPLHYRIEWDNGTWGWYGSEHFNRLSGAKTPSVES